MMPTMMMVMNVKKFEEGNLDGGLQVETHVEGNAVAAFYT